MPAEKILSWQQIAHALAARVQNFAHCDTHHTIALGLQEGCPFCQDREALRLYEAKAGPLPSKEPEGREVPIHQIPVTQGRIGDSKWRGAYRPPGM